MWCNDQIQTVVKRKEEAWKEVMRATDEDARKMCMSTKKKREKGLDVRQVRRMVHDRSELREFVKGNAWGVA